MHIGASTVLPEKSFYPIGRPPEPRTRSRKRPRRRPRPPGRSSGLGCIYRATRSAIKRPSKMTEYVSCDAARSQPLVQRSIMCFLPVVLATTHSRAVGALQPRGGFEPTAARRSIDRRGERVLPPLRTVASWWRVVGEATARWLASLNSSYSVWGHGQQGRHGQFRGRQPQTRLEGERGHLGRAMVAGERRRRHRGSAAGRARRCRGQGAAAYRWRGSRRNGRRAEGGRLDVVAGALVVAQAATETVVVEFGWRRRRRRRTTERRAESIINTKRRRVASRRCCRRTAGRTDPWGGGASLLLVADAGPPRPPLSVRQRLPA